MDKKKTKLIGIAIIVITILTGELNFASAISLIIGMFLLVAKVEYKDG